MHEKHFHVQSFASKVILCSQSGVNFFYALVISSESVLIFSIIVNIFAIFARSFLQKLKKASGLTLKVFFRTDRI